MIKAGLLAVALVLVAIVPAGAQAPEVEPDALTPPRVSYLDGPVSFWRPGAEGWTAAEANVALAPGDELYTAHRGNVEVQVGARAFVRAWGDTQFGLADHTAEMVRLRVTEGHVAVDARALDPGALIQIQTPAAAFAIDRPGYYRVDVAPERVLFVTRRGGQATMTRVEGGATHTSAAPDPDVWDRWNLARTDELLRAASARYVPEGVYGVHDLDLHGDWRVLPTYGAVWVPRGAPAGWAPYTTGRWIWDPRFGWTWVDTAAWGWAPYHHGRWVYLDGLWAWAPGPVVVRPVYAPALVAFFTAPGVRVAVGTPFVSWVALGWGEPIIPWWGRPGFIGRPAWHGWGGPRVVNNVVIQRTTIVNVHDVRVYRNAGVHRAVVAMPPDRFGRARVQDARVTQIDTRRLQPVRGPLRAVPESSRRAEPSGPRASEPTARSPRVSPGTPPDVRGESPRERRRDRDAAPSAAPRGEPTPPVVQPERRPSDRTPPRVEAAPRRPEPVPPRVAPEPRRESTPPRVAPEPRRAEPPPRVVPEPRRAEPPPRVVPEPRRAEPPPRVVPEAPRAVPTPPRAEAEPRRAEPPPRVEPPRSQMPPRIDSGPALAPRVERPRPVLRPGDEPPPRAAERPGVGPRERSERRAAPGAAAPALKGAAARERPGRGGQPGAR